MSYSNELAATFHRMFRLVVKSDWYRAIFPAVRIVKDTETILETSRGGFRFSTSVGGTITGMGFDVIIIDDPMKADEAQSEVVRKKVIAYYRETLVSRLDDQRTGAFILVMQRLHEDDLAGYLLERGGWQHLDLPAIAQEDQVIQVGPNTTRKFPRGELLHPARLPQETLEQIKADISSLAFSAQYFQRPVPLDGNLIRREWFKLYETLPDEPVGEIVQSWDAASTTSDTSNYSVCTTWRVVRQDCYLIHVWRGRLEYPALKKKYIELSTQFSPDATLIDKAGPGLHLFQDFFHDPPNGISKPIAIRAEGDKVMRMVAQSARIQAGQVQLPAEALWLSDFLHEMLAFPNAKHDDQVDSVSQFLKWKSKPWSRGRSGGSIGAPRIICG